MIQAEKMIMMSKKQYTLTISTNPASATCTLTYNGNSYSSKTCTVDEGTIVSYSIYHSTYGTKTGSVTINSDKTITATGTYSIESSSWSRPDLSANGTLGGSSFAVSADSQSSDSYAAWRAVNGNYTSLNYNWLSANTDMPHWYIFYNPQPLKVTKLHIYNYSATGLSAVPASGKVQGSDTNGNWTNICSWTNSVTGARKQWDIAVSSTNFYKYHRIYISTNYQGTKIVGFNEVQITATQGSYTYYWDIST